MNYQAEVTRAMKHLGEHPDTLFLGQTVKFAGTVVFGTLKDVPDDKRFEMPVNEDMQAGVANGLALTGIIPVSIYPRWNFLLLATNQIINHLDKISLMSDFKPKVIIRTLIGAEKPVHPQHQHVGDYTDAFKLMSKTIEVIRLDNAEDIFPAYDKALNRTDGRSTLLVEWGDKYDK